MFRFRVGSLCFDFAILLFNILVILFKYTKKQKQIIVALVIGLKKEEHFIDGVKSSGISDTM